MTLGERLRRLRQSSGLSQEEVARSLYITRQSVSKWENGQAEPGVDSLKALAALYGVTIDELVGNEVPPPEEELPPDPETLRQAEQWYQGVVAARTVLVIVLDLLLQELSLPFDWLMMLVGLKVRNTVVWALIVVFVAVNLAVSTISFLGMMTMPLSLIFMFLHGAVLWAVLQRKTKLYFQMEKE